MTQVPASISEVREAGPAEWPEMAELTVQTYAALAPTGPPPSWTAYLDSIAQTVLQTEGAAHLVVDAEGRIAASVLLCPPSAGPAGGEVNPYPELRLLAVRTEQRNRGLAGRLIEACEQRVRADGYDALTLHTTSLMPTAKAMYERRGYLRAPELDFEPEPGFVVWGYRRRLR